MTAESDLVNRVSLFHRSRFSFVESLYIFIVVALMAMEILAFFHDGAYFIGTMTLFVAVNWLLLFISLTYGRQYSFLVSSREALVAISLLFLFWVWNGLSIFWSITPDESWVEFNRTGGYLAFFTLGIIVGRKAISRNLALLLFPLSAMTAILYGLGSKIFPESIENLTNAARINIPLGYVNGVGLLIALSLMLLLHIASSKKYFWGIRIAAVAALPVALVTLFFTLSRGSVLTLIVGAMMLILLSPQRLRIAGILILVVMPASLIVWWSSGKDPLMYDLVAAGEKLVFAASLRNYLLGAVAMTSLVFGFSLFLGKRIRFSPVVVRYTGIVLLAVAIMAMSISSFIFIKSKPSFSVWLNQTIDTIQNESTVEEGAARLLSVGSTQRLNLWREAVENWDEHPLGGTGAQSFPVVHLMKRDSNQLFVKQPHGLPFRILAELGAIGMILFSLFIVLAVAISTRLYCMVKDRWERGTVAAFLAFCTVYLIHTAYDWDWNLFSLTGAYFLFTGIAVGWYASEVYADRNIVEDQVHDDPGYRQNKKVPIETIKGTM